MRRALALLLPLVAACAGAPTQLAPAQAASLTAAAHRPSWARLEAASQGIQLQGTAYLFGREEPFSLLLAGDGRFRREVQGPLGQLEVFDGERAFRQDAVGLGRELDLGDRIEAPILAALLTGAWIQEAGFCVRSISPNELVLSQANTPLEFELGLDPLTRLPARVVEETSGGEQVMTLLDWQPIGGVSLPRRIHIGRGAGAAEAVSRYRVTSATVVALEPHSFQLASSLPTDFTVDATRPKDLEARKVATGHLLVHPLIEGHDVGWFLLDSGAGAMVISTAAARELELEALGEVRAVGVAGSQATRYLAADQLELGPLTWRHPIFVELDLDFVSEAFGLPVAGIIGYDLFSRVVLEIDASAVAPGGAREGQSSGITLHASSDFEPDPDWPFVELAFQGKAPCAEARFPTRRGPRVDWFRLDTGANGALTFHSPAVVRYDLLAQRETTVANFGGVGGEGFGYFGELAWFELGGRRLAPVAAGFAMSRTGTFSEGYTAGNIGQDLFRGARLVFDYARERLYFAPSLESVPLTR